MTEPITELFARVEREGDTLPLPATREITTRGRQLRRRRRVVPLATAATVAVIALAVNQWGGSGPAPGLPARGTELTSSPTGSPTGTGQGRTVGDGLLELTDLGPGGWIRGTVQNDAGDARGAFQPGCATGSAGTSLDVSGTGRHQMFRGSTPEGAEWLLDEKVITVPDDQVAALRALLAGTAAPGCTAVEGAVVLAASDSVLVTGTLLPEGSVGSANNYALAGRTWISLETLPGGAIGQIPVPGQAQWLLDVTAKALQRATGTRPTMPAPNAAAQQAAARYVPPTAVIHVASQQPGDPVTVVTGSGSGPAAGGSAAGGSAPPKGYLRIADLGTRGGFTVDASRPGDASDWRPSPTTSVALPTCAGSGGPVTGPGSSLTYRGSTSGGSGEWIVSETLVTLRGAALAQAKAALAAAARCASVGGGFSGPAVRAAGTTSTSLVLGFPVDAGSSAGPTVVIGFAQAWGLRGDVLVQLDTLPGGAAGHAPLPGGSRWLQGVLAAALTRATAG